jgi:outer membrane protein OmpA-like peptidoglycan-associated protein
VKKFGVLVAAGVLFAALPSFAQTVGTCPRGGGGNQPQPVRILFDLGSSQLRPAERPAIAQAVKIAKDR